MDPIVKNDNLRNHTSSPKKSTRRDGTIFVGNYKPYLKTLKIQKVTIWKCSRMAKQDETFKNNVTAQHCIASYTYNTVFSITKYYILFWRNEFCEKMYIHKMKALYYLNWCFHFRYCNNLPSGPLLKTKFSFMWVIFCHCVQREKFQVCFSIFYNLDGYWKVIEKN